MSSTNTTLPLLPSSGAGQPRSAARSGAPLYRSARHGFPCTRPAHPLLILRDDIAQNICDILPVVGGLLEPLDDLLKLDDVDRIRLLEKVRHRIVHQIVRGVI